MLEKLRKRRLVFVGDSIGRNQRESLLCMLATAVPDNSSIYEGSISNGTRSPPAGAPNEVRMTVRVDTLDWTSPKWKDADVLIINSGHWWNYGKTIRWGCYFQDRGEVKMEMSVESAYRRSIESLID